MSADQKLLLQMQRLGDDGASAARPHEPDGCYDQVDEKNEKNEKNEEITRWRRIVIKPEHFSQDVAINSASVP